MNTSEYDKKFQKKRHIEEDIHRVNELINTVENYTRTQRHLEQHSDISDVDHLCRAREMQASRRIQIDNLKNAIVYDGQQNENPISNTRYNYEATEGYLDHYADKLDEETVSNLEQKQENRKKLLGQMT